MSLNCLTCNTLQRTDSDREYFWPEKPRTKFGRAKVERTWSGNISPPPYGHIGRSSMGVPAKKMKKDHHRQISSRAVSFKDDGEPRLVRSSGLRRDWSFEDLTMRHWNGDRIDCTTF